MSCRFHIMEIFISLCEGGGGGENVPVFANIVSPKRIEDGVGGGKKVFFICFNSLSTPPIKEAGENLSLSTSMWPMSSPSSLFRGRRRKVYESPG
jgi:hypothetical protein